MTTDFRARLISSWRALFDSKPDRNGVLAVGVPLGELADIALDILTDGRGVPRLPNYDASLFSEMRWTQPLTIEQIEEGAAFPTVSVGSADDIEGVRFTFVDQEGAEHAVVLNPAAAEQFCLTGLAVARHAESATP